MLPSEERIRLLSLVDIFEPLSSEEIELLNGQLPDVHLKPGEIFYSPEDRSERLFVLWKGRVRVYKTADKRQFTLSVVEGGSYCRVRSEGGIDTYDSTDSLQPLERGVSESQ